VSLYLILSMILTLYRSAHVKMLLLVSIITSVKTVETLLTFSSPLARALLLTTAESIHDIDWLQFLIGCVPHYTNIETNDPLFGDGVCSLLKALVDRRQNAVWIE
jgi:hypothetical protein